MINMMQSRMQSDSQYRKYVRRLDEIFSRVLDLIEHLKLHFYHMLSMVLFT